MSDINFVTMKRNGMSDNVVSTDADYNLSGSSGASTSAIIPYGVDDKIGFFTEWQTSNTSETGILTVKAGDEGLAFQRALGDLTLTFTATHANKVNNVVGPFETARFAKSATSTGTGYSEGDMVIELEWNAYSSAGSTGARAGAGDIHNIKLVPFKMPTVF